MCCWAGGCGRAASNTIFIIQPTVTLNFFIAMNAGKLLDVISLGLIQGVDYIFPLLVIPFLIKKIGIDGYGEIAFLQAIGFFLLIFVDYGFSLYALKLVSANKSLVRNSLIYSSVQAVKITFLITCAVLIFAASHLIEKKIEASLLLSIIIPLGSLLNPQWYFIGSGNIKKTSVVIISAKFLLIASIFFLVNEKSDIYLASILLMLPNSVGGIFATLACVFGKKLILVRPSAKIAKIILKNSTSIFLATVSSSLYRMTNPIVVGFLSSATDVAIYSIAEKIVKAAQEISRPVSQVVYRDVSLIAKKSPSEAKIFLKRKGHFIFIPAAFSSVAVYIFSPEISKFFYGHESELVSGALKIMAVCPLIGSLNLLLGGVYMISCGYSKEFAKFVFLTGLFGLAFVFPAVYNFGYIGAAFSYLGSELFLLIVLIFFHAKNKLLIRIGE